MAAALLFTDQAGFFRQVSIAIMTLVDSIGIFERVARARDGRFDTPISFIFGGIQGGFGREYGRFIEDHPWL